MLLSEIDCENQRSMESPMPSTRSSLRSGQGGVALPTVGEGEGEGEGGATNIVKGLGYLRWTSGREVDGGERAQNV
ncbi:hypothetical protein L484_011033 [Morus notabilis]|uniref:Uncharacterized protein n=1 Tax=Morus notabilis TaxID=981085 RepID=W9RQZ7_9ROSA|nr:hypothetical protein L484_011033 [Morus notabilis]